MPRIAPARCEATCNTACCSRAASARRPQIPLTPREEHQRKRAFPALMAALSSRKFTLTPGLSLRLWACPGRAVCTQTGFAPLFCTMYPVLPVPSPAGNFLGRERISPELLRAEREPEELFCTVARDPAVIQLLNEKARNILQDQWIRAEHIALARCWFQLLREYGSCRNDSSHTIAAGMRRFALRTLLQKELRHVRGAWRRDALDFSAI
ncbi:MAG: hypothetical protein ACQEQV_02655 [Fibrobacterota bacterium]